MDVKRKRKVRSCINDRCESLAEKICRVKSSKEMIVASLKDLYLHARVEGYTQHIKDAAAFRQGRDRAVRHDWLLQKTAIDDMIHSNK